MYFTSLTTQIMLLVLTSTSILAAPTEDFHLVRGEILPAGYTYTSLRMTGSIGDIALNHTGTIEEILAQVVDENPGFKIEDVKSTAATGISSRDEETKSDMACYPFPGQPNWRAAEVRYIDDGIAYLKKVTASCWVNGNSCSRISCSYKSAISLCNVTPNTKALSCSYMASYAQDILNKCAYNVGLQRLVGGQYWDTEGYNINIFRDTSC